MPPPTNDEYRAILKLYEPLYLSIELRTNPEKPVLLAHYTSVAVVEQILRNDEVWFANPLYMNDLEEMRAGIFLGTDMFPEFAKDAGGSDVRTELLTRAYNFFFEELANNQALDTYVFCLCQHKPGDTDGKLSMWREYGSKGNGAALVFNTARINYQEHSPLVVAKVAYKTKDERIALIRQGLKGWTDLTKTGSFADDHLYLAAHAALQFITSLALTTKHKGFEEEEEWRVIYVQERDRLKFLERCKSYFVGPRGLEPKLKLKFGVQYDPDPLGAAAPINAGKLSAILESILLGPTVSSPLAKSAFQRMLDGIKKPELKNKVFTSGIPLRPS